MFLNSTQKIISQLLIDMNIISLVVSLCIERREQNQIMVLMVCRILENKNHLLDNDRIVSIEKEIFFKLRHALT